MSDEIERDLNSNWEVLLNANSVSLKRWPSSITATLDSYANANANASGLAKKANSPGKCLGFLHAKQKHDGACHSPLSRNIHDFDW